MGQGATGPSGLAGTSGSNGPPGPTGLQGNPGDTGLQGTKGAKGKDGSSGAPGDVGKQVTWETRWRVVGVVTMIEGGGHEIEDAISCSPPCRVERGPLARKDPLVCLVPRYVWWGRVDATVSCDAFREGEEGGGFICGLQCTLQQQNTLTHWGVCKH